MLEAQGSAARTAVIGTNTVTGRSRRRLTEEEFNSLYARTARPLAAYIGRVTSDVDGAPDLAQEAYLRVLRAEMPEMSEKELTAYLYKTASRLVHDRWRRNKVERRWRESISLADPSSAAPDGARIDVDRILARLRPRDRAVVWLAYVEGRSHQEIGGILGLRTASIRVLLFRARKKLAVLLADTGLAPEGTSR